MWTRRKTTAIQSQPGKQRELTLMWMQNNELCAALTDSGAYQQPEMAGMLLQKMILQMKWKNENYDSDSDKLQGKRILQQVL